MSSVPAPGAAARGTRPALTRTAALAGRRAKVAHDFRPDIQGLRALAVLLVVADHAGLPGLGAGFVGVDVFFVISGFVITQLLLREAGKGLRQGMADFYARRVRRIVPAATVTLIGTVVAAGLLGGGRVGGGLPGDVRWASVFLANFRLIHTGSSYFVPGLQPSLITQFWSLAVEEQFYLCFPLAVFLVARFVPPARRLAALGGLLAVGVGLSAWWSAHQSITAPTVAYYSPLTRFWELGLGCLLAVLTAWAGRPSAGAARLFAAVGAALMVVALIVIGPRSAYPGTLAWLPCGASALLIWAGVGVAGGRGPRSRVTSLLSTRPLVRIGDLSYSLYLVHFAWLNLPGQIDPSLTGAAWRLIELAGIALTAVCSYRLLEDPIRRSRLLAGDKVAVALVLAVCVAASWTAAGAVGHWVYH